MKGSHVNADSETLIFIQIDINEFKQT